jgi:hypothetical protein
VLSRTVAPGSCIALYACRAAQSTKITRRSALVAISNDGATLWDYSPSDAGRRFANDSEADFVFSMESSGSAVSVYAYSRNVNLSSMIGPFSYSFDWSKYISCYDIYGRRGYLTDLRIVSSISPAATLSVDVMSMRVDDGTVLFNASIAAVAPPGEVSSSVCATRCYTDYNPFDPSEYSRLCLGKQKQVADFADAVFKQFVSSHAVSQAMHLKPTSVMLLQGAVGTSCVNTSSTLPCLKIGTYPYVQYLIGALLAKTGSSAISINLPAGTGPYYFPKEWPPAVASDGCFLFSSHNNIIRKYSVNGLLQWQVDAEQLVPFNRRDPTAKPDISLQLFQLDCRDNLYMIVRQYKDPFSVIHHVVALSSSGRLLWRSALPDLNRRNSLTENPIMAVGRNAVYVGTRASTPVALQLSDGRELWRLSDPDGVSELAVCTQFLLIPSANFTSLVFGDCVGRLWSFADVSQAPHPPQPPATTPFATATATHTTSIAPFSSAAPLSSQPPATAVPPPSPLPPPTPAAVILVEVQLSCPSLLNFTLLAEELSALLACPRPLLFVAAKPARSNSDGWTVTVAMLPQCATFLHDQSLATADKLQMMGVLAVDPAAVLPAAAAAVQLSTAAVVAISVAATALFACAVVFVSRRCSRTPSASTWLDNFSLLSYIG